MERSGKSDGYIRNTPKGPWCSSLRRMCFLHTGSDIKIRSILKAPLISYFFVISKNLAGLSFNFIILAILIDSTVFVPDCRSKRVAKNERWHIGTKAVRQNWRAACTWGHIFLGTRKAVHQSPYFLWWKSTTTSPINFPVNLDARHLFLHHMCYPYHDKVQTIFQSRCR